MAVEVSGSTVADERRTGRLVYRQSAWTRATHWIWAITIFFMVTSGLSIFNARPDLYIGQQSGFGFHNAILDIHAERTDSGRIIGVTNLFGHRFDTTGVLGASGDPANPDIRAFPSWATIPSYYDLATGRVIHFFFAWILVFTMLVWFGASLINGHLWRDIIPKRKDVKNLPGDLADHARFRFRHGRSYSVLQKFAYGALLIIVIPLIIATGLTMSPGVDASWPWLVDLFGGRQTARTIHFICMALIVLFFAVHIFMVLAAGPVNELRSIVTGWYRTDEEPLDRET